MPPSLVRAVDPPPFPGVDDKSCQLLGPTALIVQALMGVLVILSLVYKRHREKPHRPWRIWMFDVSKQLVGQAFVHGVNVLVSDLAARYTTANSCVFYFLNILVDTTLGVGLIYLALHGMTYVLTEKLNLKGFESGQYGTPPSKVFWLKQATIYVVALILMKFIVLGLLILCPWLFNVAEWLLSWIPTTDGDALQVIFTMGIFPIMMNVLQFWLIDSIVKASASVALSDDDTEDSTADREPLFNGGSDDEDDDDNHRHHHHPRDIENARSRSPSRQDKSTTLSEPKTTTTTTTTTPSSSSASSSNIPANHHHHHHEHEYPPSLSNSFTSSSSSSSRSITQTPPQHQPPIKQSKLKPKPKKGAPAPLHIRPSAQPAVNSPSALGRTATPGQQQPQKTRMTENVDPNSTHLAPKLTNDDDNETNPNPIPPTDQSWENTWDDEDDWANRVGEDDWTGETRKDGLGVPGAGVLVGMSPGTPAAGGVWER